MPRPEFANSAGSQFFICLDYHNTKALDRRYTAFGKVIDGMNAVHEIAKTPVGGETQAGGFTVGVEQVTDQKVVVRVRP